MIKGPERLERWGEVRIRRHIDGSECDVIVAIGDREMVVQLPNYKLAVKWAQMESRANKLPAGFSEDHPG